MNWIDGLERLIKIFRGEQLSPEQQEARNKTRIIATFCLILIMMVAAFITNTTSVEQPMKDIAPADKFNYDTLKLIATQIFTVLTLLLGAKAVAPSQPAPPEDKKEDDAKPV